jgi:hypothetical protein
VRSYLIETFLPRSQVDELRVRIADLRDSVQELRQAGVRIRYVRSTFLPEDEICFQVVEASSLEAVRMAVEHAMLPADRITEAVDDTQRPDTDRP